MTKYSTPIPSHMCAEAIVQFCITTVVYGESRNFPEDKGRDPLVKYGVGPTDLDLEAVAGCSGPPFKQRGKSGRKTQGAMRMALCE